MMVNLKFGFFPYFLVFLIQKTLFGNTKKRMVCGNIVTLAKIPLHHSHHTSQVALSKKEDKAGSNSHQKALLIKDTTPNKLITKCLTHLIIMGD
jgi:hypothetical protein